MDYDKALAKAKAADRIFAEVKRAYRAREIGDEQFLAARREWYQATREFDDAYLEACEQSTN